MSSETSTTATEVVTPAGEVLRFSAEMHRDARIAQVADAQHGVISVAQLSACGLGPGGARERAAAGGLHRIHRGVYTPGRGRLGGLGTTLAAVLACGGDAAASHLTAAWLHALRVDNRAIIDITVASRTGQRHGCVVTHSAARIRPQDLALVENIPVTSVARTLLDCAAILDRRGTEKLCLRAERHGTFDLGACRDLLAHVPGHRGVANLRMAIGDAAGAHGMTEPGDEDRLLAAFRAAGLPEPECNAPIQLPDGSWVVADFLWRDRRLVVEADSGGWHDNTFAYRSDRRRDRALRRQGYEPLRFSDEDMRDPTACAAEVGGFLG